MLRLIFLFPHLSILKSLKFNMFISAETLCTASQQLLQSYIFLYKESWSVINLKVLKFVKYGNMQVLMKSKMTLFTLLAHIASLEVNN